MSYMEVLFHLTLDDVKIQSSYPLVFFLLSQGQWHPYLVNITMQGCVAV